MNRLNIPRGAPMYWALGALAAALLLWKYMAENPTAAVIRDVFTVESVAKNNLNAAEMIVGSLESRLDAGLTAEQRKDIKYRLYLVTRQRFTREWYAGQFQRALAEVYHPDEYAAVIKCNFPPTPQYLERFRRFRQEVLPRFMNAVPEGFMAARDQAIRDFLTENNIVIKGK